MLFRSHTEEAWAFVRWMTSLDGIIPMNEGQQEYAHGLGRIYVPDMTANRVVNETVFDKFAPKEEQYRSALRTCLDLMPVSRYRPVTFVGQRLWDEHIRSFDLAIYHKKDAKAALDESTAVVQKELDTVFAERELPLFNWKIPYGIAAVAGVLLLLIGGVLIWRAEPIGPLRKQEAVAGYLFASPWVIGFLVFTGGPILASIVYSFCSYDVLHPAKYVGFANYQDLLKDPIFMKALFNAGYLWQIGRAHV
mgnify:FL=1